MRLFTVLLVIASCGSINAASKAEADLVVYLDAAPRTLPIVARAERQAEEMLATPGVSVSWRYGTVKPSPRAEVIEATLQENTSPTFHPGTMAFATLGKASGTRIVVFYDRMRGANGDGGIPPLLAHVLVHEITHILEGVNRHSNSGVMKAHWGADEQARMGCDPLPFAPEDLQLIRAWLDARRQTVTPSDRALVASSRR